MIDRQRDEADRALTRRPAIDERVEGADRRAP